MNATQQEQIYSAMQVASSALRKRAADMKRKPEERDADVQAFKVIESHFLLFSRSVRLLAEVKQLLSNARFLDGQGVVLTQNCEALEAILKEIE